MSPSWAWSHSPTPCTRPALVASPGPHREESHGAQEEPDLALLCWLLSLLQTEGSLAGRGLRQPPILETGSQRGIFCPVP